MRITAIGTFVDFENDEAALSMEVEHDGVRMRVPITQETYMGLLEVKTAAHNAAAVQKAGPPTGVPTMRGMETPTISPPPLAAPPSSMLQQAQAAQRDAARQQQSAPPLASPSRTDAQSAGASDVVVSDVETALIDRILQQRAAEQNFDLSAISAADLTRLRSHVREEIAKNGGTPPPPSQTPVSRTPSAGLVDEDGIESI